MSRKSKNGTPCCINNCNIINNLIFDNYDQTSSNLMFDNYDRTSSNLMFDNYD